MKRFLIMPLVVLMSLFAGCVKDGNETIVLPGPARFGGPLSSVIPDAIRDQLESSMPLYNGGTPPDISGNYETGKLKLSGTNYTGNYANNAFVNKLLNDMDGFNLTRGANGALSFQPGSSESGIRYDAVNVIGDGNNFTAYFSGYQNYDTASVLMSGTLTDNGIEDFHYAVITKDGGGGGSDYCDDRYYDECPRGRLMPAYFVFEDESGPVGRLKAAYTVKFDANGGDGSVKELSVDAEGRVTLPSGQGLTREGYTFGGWNTRENGNGINYEAGSSYAPEGNVTLYAKWNPVVLENEFVDIRNDKRYRKTTIGAQTWMAENLNWKANATQTADTGRCYNNNPDSCAKYGRLYSWAAAMEACPAGWHLPSDEEWAALVTAAGATPGTKLKSATGWRSYDDAPAGTNIYDFSALPGGYYGELDKVTNFYNAGYEGSWWSATAERDGTINAWYRYISYADVNVGRELGVKTGLLSVRCVENP